jgi:hypothetical protein
MKGNTRQFLPLAKLDMLITLSLALRKRPKRKAGGNSGSED